MKKLLITITAIICCFSAFSNNQTIYIKAQWEKGMELNYEITSKNYEVKNDDTTILNNSREFFKLKVIDSTKDGYTLSISRSKETPDNYTIKSAIDALYNLENMLLSIPFEFKTNKEGYCTFENLINFEEYKSRVYDSIKVNKSMVKEYLEKEQKSKLSDKKIHELDSIYEDILNYMTIDNIKSDLEPILSMFAYHGKEYKENVNYTSETADISPIDNETKINGTRTIEFEIINTKMPVGCITDTFEYDSEELTLNFNKYNEKKNQESKNPSETPGISAMKMSCTASIKKIFWPFLYKNYTVIRFDENRFYCEEISINIIENDINYEHLGRMYLDKWGLLYPNK